MSTQTGRMVGRFSAMGLSLTLLAMGAASAVAAPLATPELSAATKRAATSSQVDALPLVQVAKRAKGRRGVARKARRAVKRRGVVRRRGMLRRRLPHSRRYYRRRALRRGIGIGIGLGIVALIARESANAEFRAAMRRCDRRYRSFDWETGTYVNGQGRVRLCPYLRPYI